MTYTIHDQSIGANELGWREYPKFPIMASPGLACMRHALLKLKRGLGEETYEEFCARNPNFVKTAGARLPGDQGMTKYWITVSMPPGTEPPAFLAKLEQMSWAWSKGYQAVMEHLESNIHCHILVTKSTVCKSRPSHIIRDLSNYFGITKNFVDVASSSDDELNATRFLYLMGNKKVLKEADCAKDRADRLRWGVPHIIERRLNL